LIKSEEWIQIALMKPPAAQRIRPYAPVLLRFILGSILVFAGLVKAFHPTSFADPLREMAAVPPWSVPFIVVLLPPLEVVLGLFILHGERLALCAGLVMNLLFLAILSTTYFGSGRVVDCGCFGGVLSSKTDTWGIASELLFVMAYATLVFRTPIRKGKITSGFEQE
jgi:uncharacterized membrane protein YphA (DoxX/SURF4 family)